MGPAAEVLASLSWIRAFGLAHIPARHPASIAWRPAELRYRPLVLRSEVEKAGAPAMFLTAYSPDLNPIEMAFSKLKAMLRKAKERTAKGLWTWIGEVLAMFSSQECRNYLAHQGYVST